MNVVPRRTMNTNGGTENFIVIFFHNFMVIFLGHFCPRGKGAMRLSLCEAPTRETRPDHNTGNYVPYSFRINSEV